MSNNNWRWRETQVSKIQTGIWIKLNFSIIFLTHFSRILKKRRTSNVNRNGRGYSRWIRLIKRNTNITLLHPKSS